MQRAVIFDVDGVLVDSYQAHFESWRLMLAEHGMELTEDQFRTTFGRTTRDIIAALFPHEVAEDQIQELDNRKEALFRDILRRSFPAGEGASDLIEALAGAGFGLAVGSSAQLLNVELTLEHLPQGELIAAKVSGDDVTRGKPDPEVFLLAAERLDVPPARCAVVEDAPAGVEAANRAGMASIGLTGTATRTELDHARLVVDSLRELSPEVIGRLIDG